MVEEKDEGSPPYSSQAHKVVPSKYSVLAALGSSGGQKRFLIHGPWIQDSTVGFDELTG